MMADGGDKLAPFGSDLVLLVVEITRTDFGDGDNGYDG